MESILKAVKLNLQTLNSIIKEKYGSKTYYPENKNCKRQKTSKISHQNYEYASSSSSNNLEKININEKSEACQSLSFSVKPSTLFKNEILSECEESMLNNILDAIYLDVGSEESLIKIHAILHSLWQKLHTGHWSQVPLELREFYSWGSIFLVWFLLKDLLNTIESDGTENVDLLRSKSMKIVLACDRGLLMGKPLKENPLHKIASCFNRFVVENFKEEDKKFPFSSNMAVNIKDIPREAIPFSDMISLQTLDLPTMEEFLLQHMNLCPLKISNLAKNWPALEKWSFSYFQRMAGARTVPVEVGLRYTDADWSQVLMTIEEYLRICIEDSCNLKTQRTQKAYLAQHQLFDQIPELLRDIIIPDYCHMGENEPVLNAWIGPQGTVTPIHHDPDHNILVQVYGYKTILLFPKSDSKFLYAFDDEMLNNTSMVNLEDDTQRSNFFEKWPLLKNLKGYYVTLGPGDGLYIPPEWWHYVRSLTNSISVSFWWR